MTPEGKVKDYIKRFLKSLPDCWFFMPIGGAFAAHGTPDIICCINGRMVAIECKAPGKESNVTANQQRAIDLINKAGGLAFVASHVDHVKLALAKAGLYVL